MSVLKQARLGTKPIDVTLPNSGEVIKCYPLGKGGLQLISGTLSMERAADALESRSLSGLFKLGDATLAALLVAGLRDESDELFEDFDAMAAEDQKAIVMGIWSATFPKGIADFFGGSDKLEGLIGSIVRNAGETLSSYFQNQSTTTPADSSTSPSPTSETSSIPSSESDSPSSPQGLKPGTSATPATPNSAEAWATS